MFEVLVDDVLVINKNVAVSGKCINKHAFTAELVDDNGNKYAAGIPFIKHLIPPDPDYITLEISGAINPNLLKGCTLRSPA